MTTPELEGEFYDAVRRIYAFADYPNGWNYGRGRPATLPLAVSAVSMLKWLVDRGLISPRAFLGDDGQVQVKGALQEHTISLTAEVDGTISIEYSFNRREIFYEPDMQPARAFVELNRILSELPQSCNTSAWSTLQSDTIESNRGLQASHSPRLGQVTEAVPQSYRSSAQKQIAVLPAHMRHERNIAQSPVNPQFSGRSMIQHSVPLVA